MDQSNSAKISGAKAPQFPGFETTAKTNNTLSPVERYLGLIKAMAIIMAVLIVAAVVLIVVTIYGRLTVTNVAKTIQTNELMIPTNSQLTSASLGEKGQILLILKDATGQQLWHIDPDGKVRRKTRVIQSP